MPKEGSRLRSNPRFWLWLIVGIFVFAFLDFSVRAEYWNLAGTGAISLIVLVGLFWYYKSYSKRQEEREFSNRPLPKPTQVESADVPAPQGGYQSTQQFCYCWNCGEKNLFGLSVCMKCGKKLYHE